MPLVSIGGLRRLGAWIDRHQATVIVVCLALVAVALLHNLLPFFGETADDAAISFAYAKHLAEGHGLVHSVGAEPVEGYSNPLWVLLLALTHLIGFEIERTARLLLVASALLVLFFAFRIPRQLERDDRPRWSDLLAPLLIASSPEFIVWTPSGMENAFYSALMLAALSYLAAEQRPPGSAGEEDDGAAAAASAPSSAFRWSAVLVVAVAWTRPEGMLYAVPVVCVVLLAGWRRGTSTAALKYAAVVAGGVALLFIGRWLYFDQWWPNTYYAKVGEKAGLAGVWATDSGGWKYVLGYFKHSRDHLLLPLVAIGLIGRGTLPRLLLLGVIAVALFFPLYAGGDWMRNHRFMTPFVPLFAVAVAVGARRAGAFARWGLDRLLRGGRPRTAAAAGGTIAVSALITALLLVHDGHTGRLEKLRADPVTAYRNMRATIAFRNLTRLLQLPRASLLFADLGAPAFRSDLLLYDQGALADRTLARTRDPGQAQEYVFGELRPDLLAIFGSWRNHPSVRRAPELKDSYVELPRSGRFPYSRWGYPALRRDIAVDWTASVSRRKVALWPGRLRLEGLVTDLVRAPAGAVVRLELIAVKLRPRLGEELRVAIAGTRPPKGRPPGAVARPADGFLQDRLWRVGEPARLVAWLRLPKGTGRHRLEVTLARRGQPPLRPAASATPQVPIGQLELVRAPLNRFIGARLAAAREHAEAGRRSEALRELGRAQLLFPTPPLLPHNTFGALGYAREYGNRGLAQVVRGSKERPQMTALRSSARLVRQQIAVIDCRRSAEALSAGKLAAALARWRRARRLAPRTRCTAAADLHDALLDAAAAAEGLARFQWLRAAIAADRSATAVRSEIEALRSQLPADRRRHLFRAADAAARRFHVSERPADLGRLVALWAELQLPERIIALCGGRHAAACRRAPAVAKQLAAARSLF